VCHSYAGFGVEFSGIIHVAKSVEDHEAVGGDPSDLRRLGLNYFSNSPAILCGDIARTRGIGLVPNYRIGDAQRNRACINDFILAFKSPVHVNASGARAFGVVSLGNEYVASESIWQYPFLLVKRKWSPFSSVPLKGLIRSILEVYDLRQNGNVLLQLFGKFGRFSICRDKLKFRLINNLAVFQETGEWHHSVLGLWIQP